MDTFNRVILTVIFILALLVSALALLVLVEAIQIEQLELGRISQAIAQPIRENPVIFTWVGIGALAIIFFLGAFWLRGQFRVSAIVRGEIELPSRPDIPGRAVIPLSVLDKAADYEIRRFRGVTGTQTATLPEGENRVEMRSTITVLPQVDLHELDQELRGRIDRGWGQKFGADLSRVDLLFHVESQEKIA